MNIIKAENLTKIFGDQIILDEINFILEEKEKVALIARNGTGKTTLFNILTGNLYYEKGVITIANKLKIAYLPQENDFLSHLTLYQLMLDVFKDILQYKHKMEQLEREISTQHNKNKIKEYGDLLHKFEINDGYNIDTKIKKVLSGLSFTEHDYDKPISAFSGGERRRAFLARLLLENADLLILDEPTNHLDIFNTEWLEQYLSDFKGAIIMASHDRRFLDNVITKVWHLKDKKIKFYKGNYTNFKRQLKEEEELREKEAKKQQDFIERTKDFIRKNMEGQKTKQAQARQKMLNKIEIIQAPTKEFKPHYNFEREHDSGFIVLQAENITFGYTMDNLIFSNVSIIIEKGEKLGIVGLNGSGKSTFLKILTGELNPISGWIKYGSRVQMEYFSQNFENIDPEAYLIDEVRGKLYQYNIPEMRNYLASFGFTDETINKKMKNLSGGEKSRAILAKIILRKPNFMILDEPTNHLDLENIEALESGLKKYRGTLIIVSHDRSLLNNVCAKTLFFAPNKSPKLFLGNLDYALEKLQTNKQSNNNKIEKNNKNKNDYILKKREQRQRQNKIRKLEKQINNLEEKIEQLELEKTEIEYTLSDPKIFSDGKAVKKYKDLLTNINLEIDKNYDLLDQTMEELDNYTNLGDDE